MTGVENPGEPNPDGKDPIRAKILERVRDRSRELNLTGANNLLATQAQGVLDGIVSRTGSDEEPEISKEDLDFLAVSNMMTSGISLLLRFESGIRSLEAFLHSFGMFAEFRKENEESNGSGPEGPV
jgi:hypothetical protein